jgi:hypothetical protein
MPNKLARARRRDNERKAVERAAFIEKLRELDGRHFSTVGRRGAPRGVR